MIISFLPLAKSIAGKYGVKTNQRNYFEIRSVIYVGLVTACHRLCGKKDIEREKVNSYVVSAMYGAANRGLHNLNLIKVPEMRAQAQLKEKGEVERDSVTSFILADGSKFEVAGNYMTADEKFDYRERLEQLVTNDIEREVLNLLIQGYSQTEIASHLEKNKSWISKIVARLRGRWRINGH